MAFSEVFLHLHRFDEYTDQWVPEFIFLSYTFSYFFICSMVAGFLDAVAKVRQFRFHNDDDLYDRLSRRFSVILLMLFTVVVSTKQYVGDPIACFAPAQFTGKNY
ncbi:unnamed protein product [Rotaria magnacalcarata]|uniref:Uncharacterized protein n=1 Tax=Rotaria magnacalcarata TaxID=392030 RepID=A0A8S3IM46_9BILA|nr:unnamed protein product [Rotaria magnacalcarata]